MKIKKEALVVVRKMVKEKEGSKRKNKFEQTSGKYRNKLIAIGIIAGIVATISYVSYDLDSIPTSAAASIDGIECNTKEYVILHNHAHLDFYVNGNSMVVPERIGIIGNTCLYWMHTHDTSGVIHMESPKSRDFTLGQFFSIWKASGGFPVTGATPKIFVNGKAVTTGVNETKMEQHDEIAVVYGSQPSFIPPYYQFKEGE